MDIIGYFVFGYMLAGIILVSIGIYFSLKFYGYVYRQYPEEGKVIRSYAWQRYPGSMFHKKLKALIARYRISDAELARRARRARWSAMCFLAWCAICLLIFVAFIIYLRF